MIRRLQLKIIAVILGTLLLVFAAVLVVLNLSVHQTSVQRADDFMAFIVENDGFMLPSRDMPMPDMNWPSPDMDRPRPDMNRPNSSSHSEMMRGGRFFYVKADRNGNVFEENLQFMFGFESDDALNYVTSALSTNREKGSIDSFSFMIAEKPYGQILVFIERSIDILFIERLSQMSVWAAGIVSLILACLAVFFARWMVAPIKNSLDKQRRFISDASHELKTPLTIINANVDVLQNELGENQRLEHIRSQSERMNGLIHDMLALAKTDEGQTSIMRSNFNLSGEVLNTALEFESRVFEEGKKYTYDINENIAYTGDEKQIKQLVAILIDNAIRYSEEKGKIEVSLRKDGNHIRISVFNTGVGVPNEERKKIFERFYRTDESRSRETGGYGVGLSIAKRIVEMHKGKISVKGKHMKWIRFDVIL